MDANSKRSTAHVSRCQQYGVVGQAAYEQAHNQCRVGQGVLVDTRGQVCDAKESGPNKKVSRTHRRLHRLPTRTHPQNNDYCSCPSLLLLSKITSTSQQPTYERSDLQSSIANVNVLIQACARCYDARIERNSSTHRLISTKHELVHSEVLVSPLSGRPCPVNLCYDVYTGHDAVSSVRTSRT